jgi:hypothetical protein
VGDVRTEKGHLLEIHLLEKTARHQNLDCSTLFEQMTKKMKLLEKTPKSHFEQMQFLDQNDQLLELQLLDKNIEKCQLLEFKKVEKSGTCMAVWLKNRVS